MYCYLQTLNNNNLKKEQKHLAPGWLLTKCARLPVQRGHLWGLRVLLVAPCPRAAGSGLPGQGQVRCHLCAPGPERCPRLPLPPGRALARAAGLWLRGSFHSSFVRLSFWFFQNTPSLHSFPGT